MKLIHTSLAVILCIIMSASFAARLPSHYPEDFKYMGKMDRLDESAIKQIELVQPQSKEDVSK